MHFTTYVLKNPTSNSNGMPSAAATNRSVETSQAYVIYLLRVYTQTYPINHVSVKEIHLAKGAAAVQA